MWAVLLPLGVNTIAVKYISRIILYIIPHHIIYLYFPFMHRIWRFCTRRFFGCQQLHLLSAARHADSYKHKIRTCGPGSSVVIAPGYGSDGPGIESRWGEIFRTRPDRLWGPHSLLPNGYRVFPGGRKRPGCDVTLHPLLLARSKNRIELYRYLPKGLRGL
jgi:hypothetical protein